MNDIETTQVIPVQTMRELVFGEKLINRASHVRIERRRTVRKTVAMMLVSIGLLFGAMANAAPAQGDKVKVATCNDGKEYWSTSNTHQGACARHGGVREWNDGTPVKARAAKKGEYR